MIQLQVTVNNAPKNRAYTFTVLRSMDGYTEEEDREAQEFQEVLVAFLKQKHPEDREVRT